MYLPGPTFEAGKEKRPLSSEMTEILMFEPSFFTVRTTPSMGPSFCEETVPLSEAGACAPAGAAKRKPARIAALAVA